MVTPAQVIQSSGRTVPAGIASFPHDKRTLFVWATPSRQLQTALHGIVQEAPLGGLTGPGESIPRAASTEDHVLDQKWKTPCQRGRDTIDGFQMRQERHFSSRSGLAKAPPKKSAH